MASAQKVAAISEIRTVNGSKSSQSVTTSNVVKDGDQAVQKAILNGLDKRCVGGQGRGSLITYYLGFHGKSSRRKKPNQPNHESDMK